MLDFEMRDRYLYLSEKENETGKETRERIKLLEDMAELWRFKKGRLFQYQIPRCIYHSRLIPL